MEYYRDSNNKIQAGFALRAGQLLMQYRTLTSGLPVTTRYDATLTVCVLQSLLTNCAELLSAMSGAQKQVWSEHIPDIPHRWGLERSFVVKDTFPSSLTYFLFVKHLRNALSHPTAADKQPNLPTTGYTTLETNSDIIEIFRFTDSPWVDRGRLHSRYDNKDFKKVEAALSKFSNSQGRELLSIRCNAQKRYSVFRNGEAYLPVFVAEIPITALFKIALELANFLAQPISETWNGITVEKLVA